MAHIKLRHIVQAMPHGSGLRKRKGRLLKPVKPSHKTELWYKAQLLAVVAQLRKVAREVLLPELKRMEPLYAKASDGLARDAQVPRRSLETTFQNMAQRFGGIEQTAKRLSSLAAERNLDAVDDRLTESIKASVSIDISPILSMSGPIQEAMKAATQANIDLIKSIPGQYFDKLGDAVGQNMEAGMRFEDLAKEVERIGDVTESRAKLIARDQTSKMNSAFNQVRQTSLGIEKYIWQTSGDERVREEHALNDGETFSWDKAPPTGHPGEDIQCRCVAVPFFDLDNEEELLGL
jgi:SPP1 gp7 family putative phage head morphogenesis protein